MNLTKQICHKAAHFDAVAFDVFDTLIKRDVAVPTGLFRLMGNDFYAARIRAEREARAAQSREVTLAEIYARPCLARYDAAAECAAELAACAVNKLVLDAVQTLKEQGKKLYYISDMYLPQAQIDAMLRRCGYPCFDGGFVSCTYGVQKRSGRLFKRFCRKPVSRRSSCFSSVTAGAPMWPGPRWRASPPGICRRRLHLRITLRLLWRTVCRSSDLTVRLSAFPCWDRWQRHSANGCTRAVPPARRPGCISLPAICT